MVVVKTQPLEQTNLRDSAIGHPLNRVDALLESSRRFLIGEREHFFNENESIFFLEGPISTRGYQTTEGCNTCDEKWKKASDIQGSHCHFCGKSNCKSCLTKTRAFKQKDVVELTKSGK